MPTEEENLDPMGTRESDGSLSFGTLNDLRCHSELDSLRAKGLLPSAHDLAGLLVVVPPPPKFAASNIEAVGQMVELYKSLVLRRYMRASYIKAPTGADVLRHSKTVALMRENDIHPAKWVAWSFDVWQGYGSSKGPPPLRWVLSRTRVQSKSEWCSANVSAADIKIKYLPTKARTYLTQLRQLEDRLLEAAGVAEITPLKLSELGREVFGVSASRALQRAKHAAMLAQTDFDTRIDRGEWVWE